LLQRVERQQERMAAKGYESQPHLNKPQMNAKSKQIYDSMIAKQKIEKKDGMSHQDYLISRGKQYEQKRQQEQHRKDMEDPEARECTFAPVVQNSGRKGPDDNCSQNRLNSGNKWDELYSQAARKQGRADRSRDEIEFEKNHE